MKKTALLFFLLFVSLNPFLKAQDSQEKVRVLIASPVRQKPAILREFLGSLNRLEKEHFQAEYCFMDDNDQEESHLLLKKFAEEKKEGCLLLFPENQTISETYLCNEQSHFWTPALHWKVASFKNRLIEVAKEGAFDYLLLIDSDLALHPHTIEHLLSTQKEIVSPIYWTSWFPNTDPEHQVWLKDASLKYELKMHEKISNDEAWKRKNDFSEMLKKPGLYEVGGLCGCILISQNALQKGLSYKKIPSLSLLTADQHFCVSAAALDFPLYVDTNYPAFHIYRESDLAKLEEFKRTTASLNSEKKSPRITLSMIVKNESQNYLKRVLEDARQYITDAVIIDDASTDNTSQICEEALKGIPLRLIHNSESKFSYEVNLRRQQWDETIKTNPEWILFLDADQMFEHKFKDEVKKLVSDPDVDAYYFRQYDLWDEDHYRDDHLWRAHNLHWLYLFRYRPGVDYFWQETPQHCGSFPFTAFQFPLKCSTLRLKHYGWAREDLRRAKYQRYQKLDPGGKFGNLAQYESALDEHPNLVKFEDNS